MTDTGTEPQPAPSGQRVADAASQNLRVLIVNENEERLGFLTRLVEGLDHRVIGRETTLGTVAVVTRQELPDVALVGVSGDPEQALEMIDKIVKEAACPVVALLEFDDNEYVNEAAKRGVFAYMVADGDADELQNALDITLRRFAEYHSLQGAFGRRAIIEQAKGVLMERHQIAADQAFQLLRRQSTDTGRKLVDIAQAVIDTHRLLPGKPPPETDGS